MEKNPSELARLESDYKLWLDAFINLNPGKPSESVAKVKGRVATLLGLEKVAQVPSHHSPSADALKKWASRASLPSSPTIRTALCQVVSECLPTNPEGVTETYDFYQLVQRLQELRSRQLEQKSGAEDDEQLFAFGALRVPVCIAEDLDLTLLGLGSFLFEGGLPKYVERSIEVKVLEALNSKPEQVVVIEGPPKSGKTRLLAEALMHSDLSRWRVYWLSNLDGAIGAVIKTLKRRASRKNIIVLDDFQSFKWSLHAGEFNSRTVQELLKLAVVVSTRLPSTAFERSQTWVTGDFSSGSNSSGQLGIIPSESMKVLKLQSELNAEESKRAKQILNLEANDAVNLKLGVELSSGEILLNRFLDFSNQGPIASSMAQAALDCHALSISGFSAKIFKELSKRRLSELSPSSKWSDLLFDDALQRLTEGAGPGSPHAILCRVREYEDSHKFFDYVWSELKVSKLTLPSLDGLDVDLVSAARNLWQLGLRDNAFELLEQHLLTNLLDHLAMGTYADFLNINHQPHKALKFAEKAVALSPEDYRLYLVLYDSYWLMDLMEKCAEILSTGLALLPQNYELSIKLAPILLALGRSQEAKSLLESLPPSSFPDDLARLIAMSGLYGDCGDFEQAKTFASKALELDPMNCAASGNFALVHRVTADFHSAHHQVTNHLAICTQPCSSNQNYVGYLIDVGRPDEAAAELRKRADWNSNTAFSALLFGILAYDNEQYLEAKIHFETDNQSSKSLASFGNLVRTLLKLGDFKNAQEVCERGISIYPKSCDLLNLAGNAFLEDDEVKASDYYRRATLVESVSPHPFWNLARQKVRKGDFKEAAVLYERGQQSAKTGDSLDEFDLWALGYHAYTIGDYQNCAAYSRIRFEQSGSDQALEMYCSSVTYDEQLAFFETLPNDLRNLPSVRFERFEVFCRLDDPSLSLAKAELLSLVKEFPKSLRAKFEMGRLCLQLGDKIRAMGWFRKCDGLEDPSELRPRLNMYVEATSLALGLSSRDKLTEHDLVSGYTGTESMAFLNLAWAHLDAQNLDVSFAVTNEGLRKHKSHFMLLNNKAVLENLDERPLDAAESLRQSLSIEPSRENAFAAIQLIQILHKDGKPDEALKVSGDYLENLEVGLPPQVALALEEALSEVRGSSQLASYKKTDTTNPDRVPKSFSDSYFESLNAIKRDTDRARTQ